VDLRAGEGNLVELIAGAMLIIGWHTRLAAWGPAIFTLVAALIGHQFWAADAAQFVNQLNHFLKNIAIIGGLLMVAASGPGSISAKR
jgi:putative oxidoreductase